MFRYALKSENTLPDSSSAKDDAEMADVGDSTWVPTPSLLQDVNSAHE